MAKFNITVELDWVDEEGGIDQIVKEEIINRITERFSSKLNDEIMESAQDKISSLISDTIDNKINKILEDLLNKEFPLLDRYGDVVKSKVSVIGLLKERLDSFLEEKVDEKGNSRGYNANKTRLDYIILQNIDFSMQRKIEQAAAEVKKGLEKYMEETLKNQIGENVVKLIGLDNVMKKK